MPMQRQGNYMRLFNLKVSNDVQQFYEISKESAEIVKKYNGSLSGELDGRLRGAFIPLMVEEYGLFKRIKIHGVHIF